MKFSFGTLEHHMTTPEAESDYFVGTTKCFERIHSVLIFQFSRVSPLPPQRRLLFWTPTQPNASKVRHPHIPRVKRALMEEALGRCDTLILEVKEIAQQ